MSRVLLPKEVQRNLCQSAKQKLGSSWSVLSEHLQVSPKAFENWYRGERLLPEKIFKNLTKLSKYHIEYFELLPDNWGQIKGGRRNIELNGRFIGTLEDRRKPRNKGIRVAKYFPLPNYSEDLAEFIGIMLGDGGISKNDISITLGYSTDKEYVPYITRLIQSIFKSKVGLYRPPNQDVIRIRFYGINLIKNLLTLGLVQGNKIKQENFSIPSWILGNDSYAKNCIRGLIDTDGCIFRKVRRESNGIEYRSIGIKFTSASESLLLSSIEIFNHLGFKIARSGRDLYLSGKEHITRYVQEIGFSNPKHLNKYKAFLPSYGWIKVASQNCLNSSPSV